MKAISQQIYNREVLKSIALDLGALAFIYLVPTFAHLTSLPIYLIEPMRLMLVLALVHTNKRNAYILALTLPLFSFLISSHPVFAKMLLISFELSLNVFLFYLLKDRLLKVYPAILLSIIISKLAYYSIKLGLLSYAILDGNLISTPLFIQLITTTVFSLYLYFVFRLSKRA